MTAEQAGPADGDRGTIKKRPSVRMLFSSKSLANLSFAQRKEARDEQKQQSQPQKQQQQQQQQHPQRQEENKPKSLEGVEEEKEEEGEEENQQYLAKLERKLPALPPEQQHHHQPVRKTSARTLTSNLVEADFRLRGIDRPAPGDPSLRANMTQSKIDAAKRRSSYFGEAFGASTKAGGIGSLTLSLQDRVRGEFIVMAEVKTNVIMNDEFTFITELSYQLSLRFQRPVSSIVVTIQHGVCMMFGGTFEPAYSMTVHALPSLVQTTQNKRNAMLLQRHMEEALGVAPSRGLLRFVATPEENMAFNGKTAATEISDLAKAEGVEIDDEDASSKRLSRIKNRLSMRQSLGNFKASPSIQEITPPASSTDMASPVSPQPAVPPEPKSDEHRYSVPERPKSSPGIAIADSGKKTKRRKSFVPSIFVWPKDEDIPPLPVEH